MTRPRASWSRLRSIGSSGRRPVLNAFRCVRAQKALAEADEADRRLAAGERAPLLGVPIAIKDDIDLAGETTPFGCRGEGFETATEDCEAVRRLRAAGAVIVGKTTTPELGQWPITEGEAFGVTRDPWSLEHTPGGSSGGSAAAVAAGVVPAALGSDGLGSVRIPAAWTHLVGIKPQRGRISTWPETAAFHGLACIGPLARTVGDAALLLDAASGNHPEDRDQPPPPGSGTFADAADRGASGAGRPLRIALALGNPPFTTVRGDAPRSGDRGGGAGGLGTCSAASGTTSRPRVSPMGCLASACFPAGWNGLHDWGKRITDALGARPANPSQHLGGWTARPAGRTRPCARDCRCDARSARSSGALTSCWPRPARSRRSAVGGIDGLSGLGDRQGDDGGMPVHVAVERDRLAVDQRPRRDHLRRSAVRSPADGAGPCSEELLLELAAALETVEGRWHEPPPAARGRGSLGRGAAESAGRS